jgi:hypothetical protein
MAKKLNIPIPIATGKTLRIGVRGVYLLWRVEVTVSLADDPALCGISRRGLLHGDCAVLEHLQQITCEPRGAAEATKLAS